jgi:hypothetical protein
VLSQAPTLCCAAPAAQLRCQLSPQELLHGKHRFGATVWHCDPQQAGQGSHTVCCSIKLVRSLLCAMLGCEHHREETWPKCIS